MIAHSSNFSAWRWLVLCLSALLWTGFAGRGHACEAVPVLEGGLSHVTAKMRRGELVKVLAIGSSTTQGVGASGAARAYPAVFGRRLMELMPRLRVELTVRGYSGNKSSDILAHLREFVANGARPDLVLWQAGINDALQGVGEAQFSAVTSSAIQAVAGSNADLVMIDQPYFPGIEDLARYERFVALYDAAGASQGAVVFKRYQMMKALRQDEVRLGLLLGPDRFHLSNEGHRCLGEALARAVAGILRR